MIFIILIFILIVVSVLLALYSLKKELQKHEVEDAKRDLSKGRVVYHSSDVKRD